MDLDQFWVIVDGASTPAALHDTLDALGQDDLIAFEQLHDAWMRNAYRWDLWGAAYVINGGCGDDSFDYFRAYLISRGRAIYEAALIDPDSLADVDLEDEDAWEDWMSPTMAVVHRRTGEYGFAAPADPDLNPLGEPAGEPWDEDELPELFPRLSARYD